MNELAFENITKNKCITCDDKLTAWEINFCIMCESDQEIENFFDDDDDLQNLKFYCLQNLKYFCLQNLKAFCLLNKTINNQLWAH